MSKLRTEVGGLWLGIDSKTSEIIDDAEGNYTYLVNYIETVDTSIIDKVGDVLEGVFSFVAGGFLKFDDWILNFGLDLEGYTNSKIVDVKEWFDIEVPNVVEGMLDFLKPIVQPIVDAVDFLGRLTGILTGTQPKEQEIKDAEVSVSEHYDEVKKIIREMD